jgi:hypothetical protein
LQLDENERSHLFLLALKQPPPLATYSTPAISPTLQQFLNQLTTVPAAAVDSRLNMVAWNKAYYALFGDRSTGSERERNLIWLFFTSPLSRQRNKEWEELARVFLAQFRVGYGRFSEDPWWAEQIAELSKVSPEFRELWARHDVQSVSEGHKTFYHPIVGELHFKFILLQTVDASDLRVLVHLPCDPVTATKVEQLTGCNFDIKLS